MNLICGINPVLEALQAGSRQFDRLLVVKGLRNRRVSDAITRANELGVPLRFEAREALDRLAAGIPHQGIIAVVSPKPVMGLHDLLATAHDPALLLVLDGVEDPRNLGAIVRTVEAAGADGVLLPDRHSAGLSELVSRASAGALEHVKVARIGNVSQTLATLKEKGIWVIGLDAGGERWDKIDFKRPVALVLGGEGKGLRRLVRENCDQLAALPLFGHVTSLNVSVAAGAVLYEVIRQRGATPSHVRPIPPSAKPPAHNHVVGPDPGDGETDPGASHHEDAPEEDGDAEVGSLSLVEIHEGEDAAWRLPAELPPSERRGPRRPRPEGAPEGRSRERDRPRGRGGDSRRESRREPRTEPPRAETGGEQLPREEAPRLEGGDPARAEREGRLGKNRRRRRRGGRRPGGENGPGVAGGPGGPRPENIVHNPGGGAPGEGNPGPAEPNGNTAPPGPPGAPRPGRRRRRRRR
jgi:23S rRNA (guanosine2251-2'-O)-methyltransferase